MDPKDYQGKPDDVVQARRRVGFGTVTLQLTEFPQPGIGPCECHPLNEATGWAYAVHEGDVLVMRRREVVGFFDDDGHWNAGRADFELVDETPKASKKAAVAAEVSNAEPDDR